MDQLKPYLETVWTVLNGQPATAFLFNHGLLVTGLLACLACLGSGGMLLAGRVLARRHRRTSYDKCARQLAFVTVVLGWLTALTGKTVLVLRTGLWFAADLGGIIHEICWFLFVMTILYITIYAFLWKLFAGRTLLQNIFSGVCLVQGSVTCAAIICDARISLLMKDVQSVHEWFLNVPEVLFPPVLSETYVYLALLVPLFFLLPSVIGNIGLLLVRNRMDYGRDHYTIAVQWCSSVAVRWLTVSCIMILAYTGLLLWRQWAAQTYDLLVCLPFGILFCAVLSALLLYLCITRSPVPLRHKGMLLLADMLTVLFSLYVLYGWLS